MLKEFQVAKRQLLSDAIAENTDLGYFRVLKTIKDKSVKVNKERVGVDCNVQPGDVVAVYMRDRDILCADVLYKDDHILVANKPSGIEVVGDKSLQTMVNNTLDNGTATAVHRLDRNTMGLVVFALNKTAERELLESFKVREIDKTYNAIVVGHPRQNSGVIKNYLFKDAKKSMVYVSETHKTGYVPAETRFRVIKNLGNLSLVELKPITGRTHQLRVQMAHMQTPILGDGKYGVNSINKKYRVSTQLLACVKITFHFAKGPLKYLDGKSVVSNVDLTQHYKKNVTN